MEEQTEQESTTEVALRKESVDRNLTSDERIEFVDRVALRKESVDRNPASRTGQSVSIVALRKESVDRNTLMEVSHMDRWLSLSARRAWIEMHKCRVA